MNRMLLICDNETDLGNLLQRSCPTVTVVSPAVSFYKAWCDISSFLLSCQIYSDDMLLDGAWTRAFDIENWESHGVPHDVGWAPCCIETGWTVGEILMGLQFMQQVEKSRPKC